MNGIGLLVLLALGAQVGTVPRSPYATNRSRDFGWRVDEQGALCYIVQVSPNLVAEMVKTNQEKKSDMPAELVGRVARVCFRIGTEELPQEPSLAEIERRFPRFNSQVDVTAALEPGRIMNVEQDKIVNVQDSSFPKLPSSGSQLSDTFANMSDRAAQLGTNAIDEARKLAGGNTAATSGNPTGPSNGVNPPPAAEQFSQSAAGRMPGFPNRATDATSAQQSPTMPSFDTTTGSSRFNSTPPPTLPEQSSQGNNGWQAGNNSNLGNTAAVRPPDNLTPSNSTMGNSNQSAANPLGFQNQPGNPIQPSYQNQPDYFNRAGGFQNGNAYPNESLSYPTATNQNIFNNAIPNQQTPVGGFGGYANNGSQNTGIAGGPSMYQQPNYGQAGQSGYPGNVDPRTAAQAGMYPNSPSGPNGYPDYIASNNGIKPLPSTGGTKNQAVETGEGASDSSKLNRKEEANSGSASDSNYKNIGSEGFSKKSNDGILQVFFLLSLVVNFYLAMLIRKLLTRYRTLLSSVRGQAA